MTQKERQSFRVGAISGTGNGALDPGTVSYCGDIQHAVNKLKLLRKDRPGVKWAIRPKHGATGFKNADVDAMLEHVLMTEH